MQSQSSNLTSTMKLALLCTMLAMTTAMENIYPSTEYIPGQYIMRIAENVYNAKADVQNFLEILENELKIYIVRINTIGSLRLVLVKGEHGDVMAARNRECPVH